MIVPPIAVKIIPINRARASSYPVPSGFTKNAIPAIKQAKAPQHTRVLQITTAGCVLFSLILFSIKHSDSPKVRIHTFFIYLHE